MMTNTSLKLASSKARKNLSRRSEGLCPWSNSKWGSLIANTWLECGASWSKPSWMTLWSSKWLIVWRTYRNTWILLAAKKWEILSVKSLRKITNASNGILTEPTRLLKVKVRTSNLSFEVKIQFSNHRWWTLSRIWLTQKVYPAPMRVTEKKTKLRRNSKCLILTLRRTCNRRREKNTATQAFIIPHTTTSTLRRTRLMPLALVAASRRTKSPRPSVK